jgi:hypothetical protein
VQCSAFKECGTCRNDRKVYRAVVEEADVEEKVLQVMRVTLAAPEWLDQFVNVYNEERARLANSANERRPKLERGLGEIERELRRAIDAIVKAGASPESLAPVI